MLSLSLFSIAPVPREGRPNTEESSCDVRGVELYRLEDCVERSLSVHPGTKAFESGLKSSSVLSLFILSVRLIRL